VTEWGRRKRPNFSEKKEGQAVSDTETAIPKRLEEKDSWERRNLRLNDPRPAANNRRRALWRTDSTGSDDVVTKDRSTEKAYLNQVTHRRAPAGQRDSHALQPADNEEEKYYRKWGLGRSSR